MIIEVILNSMQVYLLNPILLYSILALYSFNMRNLRVLSLYQSLIKSFISIYKEESVGDIVTLYSLFPIPSSLAILIKGLLVI